MGKYDEAFVEMIQDEFRRWDHCLCPVHGMWYRGPSIHMPVMKEPELRDWFKLTYGIDLNDAKFHDYHDYMGQDWFLCPEYTGNSDPLEASWICEPPEDMSDEDFNAALDSMFEEEDFDPRAELQEILSERRINKYIA